MQIEMLNKSVYRNAGFLINIILNKLTNNDYLLNIGIPEYMIDLTWI